MYLRYYIYFAITLLLTSTTVSSPAIGLEIDRSRTVEISGPIDSPDILESSNKVYKLSKLSRDPIYIVINSRGGGVYSGIQFLNAMAVARERGVQFYCVVPGMAMSMAFQIFLDCDYRYALPYSLLLFHPVRVSMGFGTVITPVQARQLVEDIGQAEAILLPALEITLTNHGMSSKLFNSSYLSERMWTATQLSQETGKFLEIIYDIDGMEAGWKSGVTMDSVIPSNNTGEIRYEYYGRRQ